MQFIKRFELLTMAAVGTVISGALAGNVSVIATACICYFIATIILMYVDNLPRA